MSWMPTVAPVFIASRQASSSNLLHEGIANLHVGPFFYFDSSIVDSARKPWTFRGYRPVPFGSDVK